MHTGGLEKVEVNSSSVFWGADFQHGTRQYTRAQGRRLARCPCSAGRPRAAGAGATIPHAFRLIRLRDVDAGARAGFAFPNGVVGFPTGPTARRGTALVPVVSRAMEPSREHYILACVYSN